MANWIVFDGADDGHPIAVNLDNVEVIMPGKHAGTLLIDDITVSADFTSLLLMFEHKVYD